MGVKPSTPDELLARAEIRERSKHRNKPRARRDLFTRAVDFVKDEFAADPKGGWITKLEAEKKNSSFVVLGMYAYLHERIYGVLPEELGDEWTIAANSVERFVKFNDGRFDIFDFLRWTWQRERFRRGKDQDRDFRITWRYQFSQKLVTDFRMVKKV